ncbi:hypothetical protein [Undibacterium sp. Ji49W]|uniref:hypothetical protein n=1 Tax=Undibacterium sp. Ji49W TaxID=3413040 RepID=UPI003BF29212
MKPAFHRHLFTTISIAAAASLVACQKHEEPKIQTSSSAAAATTATTGKPATKTYDGPFGLAMGISEKEMRERFGFATIEEASHFYIGTPPKLVPGFTDYYVIATPVAGVCKIAGTIALSSLNGSGDRLREAADNLASLMEQKYGKPSNKFHTFLDDTYRRNPQFWMLGLKEHSISYGYEWVREKDAAPLPNNISSIVISVKAHTIDTGSVGASYELTNFNDCEKEFQKAKASNL